MAYILVFIDLMDERDIVVIDCHNICDLLQVISGQYNITLYPFK